MQQDAVDEKESKKTATKSKNKKADSQKESGARSLSVERGSHTICAAIHADTFSRFIAWGVDHSTNRGNTCHVVASG
jgi:hypothetical protein